MRNSDQTSRQVTFILIAGRKIRGVRPAEAKRNAKTLRIADRNVSAEFARWFDQGKCENVGCDTDQRAGAMCPSNELGIVVNSAIGRGILHERAENRFVEFETRVVVNLYFDAERLCTGADDFDRLRMAIVRYEKLFSIRNNRVTKGHGFGRGSGFVKQRGISNVEAGKV